MKKGRRRQRFRDVAVTLFLTEAEQLIATAEAPEAAELVTNTVDLDPNRTLSVKGATKAVALWSNCKSKCSLLAVGTASSVTVFSVTLPNESNERQTMEASPMEASVVQEFEHSVPLQDIAWSPSTSFMPEPVCIRFATASLDNEVRIFSSDLTENEVNVLSGHRGLVNAVAFEQQTGEALASVGDDNSCRIWGLDGAQQARIALRSAGTAVVWHPEELGKLLVAEKCGTLRLYNAMSGTAAHVHGGGPAGHPPGSRLVPGEQPAFGSSRWQPLLPVGDGTLQVGHLLLHFMPHRPLDHKPLHSNGASELAFSYLQQEVCASRGHPGNSVKVFNFKTNQVLLDVSLNVGRGLAWHPHCPVLAFGGDGRAHLFRVITC
ncbi:hypothetical protein HPB50_005171 [Hyalomma asiaticum]|uniref:Uncharacterized protein n=1 Tax=Hyalomma asiaticum TaxID=266040 RepID=A0ACB7RM15_HYAAI|nr:hypothetical protein HPB50_005171 [Hyalomma asiaticum]